jgi:hypothetical protein
MLPDPDPHSHTDPDPGQPNLGALAAGTFQADSVCKQRYGNSYSTGTRQEMTKHLINMKPHEVLACAHLSTPVSLHVSISCGNPFKLRQLDLELVLADSDNRYI